MKKSKKIISLLLSAMMLMSISCASVFASGTTEVAKGQVVDYTITIMEMQNGEVVERDATQSEKIELMTRNNRTPGSNVTIGENKYIVTDDYNLQYDGKVDMTGGNVLTDSITRGPNIPTSRGSLPYGGSYSLSTYLYSNKYFVAGESGMLNPSIGIDFSAGNAQTLAVDWIDGRNDESMGMSTNFYMAAGGVRTIYNWVHAGAPFYIKIVNRGSGWVNGSFDMYIDQ